MNGGIRRVYKAIEQLTEGIAQERSASRVEVPQRKAAKCSEENKIKKKVAGNKEKAT